MLTQTSTSNAIITSLTIDHNGGIAYKGWTAKKELKFLLKMIGLLLWLETARGKRDW